MQELLDREWPLIATDASAPHTGNVLQSKFPQGLPAWKGYVKCWYRWTHPDAVRASDARPGVAQKTPWTFANV